MKKQLREFYPEQFYANVPLLPFGAEERLKLKDSDLQLLGYMPEREDFEWVSRWNLFYPTFLSFSFIYFFYFLNVPHRKISSKSFIPLFIYLQFTFSDFM